MFKVEPKKFGVKFRYERPIKGVIETEHEFKVVEAYDIIDAIMLIKDNGKYRECSEPVVYEVSEITEEV